MTTNHNKGAHTLIILGKGASRSMLGHYKLQYPGAVLWTLNNFHPAGEDPLIHGFDLAAETHVHFDVHYDQRFWSLMDDVNAVWIVSPFRQPPRHRNPVFRFPLEEVYQRFGVAYFESSLCYMVALAALWNRIGLTELETVCLPGVDMVDPTHFSYRYGIHFWLGLLTGMGVRLEIPSESACLQRFAGEKSVDTETDFPHIYGQPWSVTNPLKQKFNWRN